MLGGGGKWGVCAFECVIVVVCCLVNDGKALILIVSVSMLGIVCVAVMWYVDTCYRS